MTAALLSAHAERSEAPAASARRTADGPADGRLWPNEEQRLLLTVALGAEPAARRAWAAWRGRVRLEDEFGWESLRLLPLVHRRLTQLRVDDPLMGRLKGVYRRAWYETHLLMHRTRPAVAALRAAGVDVLLLKGVPLAVGYYATPALRPMSDLDVCVRAADVPAALAVLRELGWRPTQLLTPDHLRFFHALQLVHPDGGEIDLHWHVVSEACGNDFDADFWADTEPFAFDGVAARQLGPTMLLLHTVLHGVRWNAEPPVRWIADAATVLAARGDDVDWTRLVAVARRHRVAHRLSLGLDHLAREFGVPVPPHALDALRRTRVSLLERLERTVALRDLHVLQSRARGNQWSIVADLARQVHPLRRPVAFAAAYPHYLRYRLRLDGRRELLPFLLRGVRRRLGARGSAR